MSANINAVELRRELRDLRHLTDALRRCISPEHIDRMVRKYRYEEEPSFHRSIPVGAARDKIEMYICDPMTTIPTLVDVTFVTREEIAGIDGVGPKTMAQLDAAMAEHGLSYAEPEEVAA